MSHLNFRLLNFKSFKGTYFDQVNNMTSLKCFRRMYPAFVAIVTGVVLVF